MIKVVFEYTIMGEKLVDLQSKLRIDGSTTNIEKIMGALAIEKVNKEIKIDNTYEKNMLVNSVLSEMKNPVRKE